MADTVDQMQIVFTVNGPGEVASWLNPLATELKRQRPGLRICVAVVPCVFSSGSENAVVRALPFVDASCSVQETLAYIVRGRLPAGFRKGGPGVVVHLGGDSVFTVMLAKRLGVPSIAYVERPIALQSFYDRVFYSGFEKVPAGSEAKVVGEMIVDAALARSPEREPARSGRKTVGLYPGSREFMVKYVLPFYAAVADRLSETMPEVDWVIAKSDFMPLDYFGTIPDVNDGRKIDGANVRLVRENGEAWIVTERGTRMRMTTNGEVASRANVAVTLPGTNTAELAALGVPMVMILPTWSAELSPLPGLAGHLGRLPVVGRYIKRLVAEATVRRMPFFTHPNRRAQRAMVPELVGEVTASGVAETVSGILSSDTRDLERDLRAIMGTPGAAKRLAGEVLDYLENSELAHEAAPAR